MGEQSRKNSIAAFAAAALLTLGGAWFGAGFYRNAPREMLTAEIVRREPVLPELAAESLAGRSNDSEEADSVSDSREDDSISDDSAPESSYPEAAGDSSVGVIRPETADSSSAGGRAVVRSEGTSSDIAATEDRTESSSAETSAPAQIPPAADAPAHTVGDGSKTDREYFTTSIVDGEMVSESVYFFTVTHLIDELELLRCDVELNGEVQEGYAGRVRLREGANTIRVSCTYRDSESMIYRAFRDYVVYLESDDAPIITDLTDRVVYEPQLTFAAECAEGVEVRLNGRAVDGSGSYTVTLAEGDNVITLTSGGRELSFTVTYIPLRELDIVTDLSDRTVFSAELTFTARAVGGSSPSLTVQVNGRAVRGADGVYTAALNEGANSIRLLARDGSDRAEKTFTVISLPENDGSRLPRLESISLTDNMTVRGSSYTLSLKAVDCDGRRIYSGNIEVVCGGSAAALRWEDAASTGYLLRLTSGENSVYIRLTDSIGRQSEFFYRINCEGAAVGEEVGRAAISVRADVLGLGVLCEDGSFPILEGETGFETAERFLRENGFEVISSGSGGSRYLARIAKVGGFASAAPTAEELAYLEGAGIAVNNSGDPDSLGEFDFTTGSGWIFYLGGQKVSYGISSAVLTDGDSIELRFSLDLGNDVRSVGE